MPTKKSKSDRSSARKLAGAVVLTASFSLFAIPDALAESGGCLSITGAMDGYNIFSGGGKGGGCANPKDRGSNDSSDELNSVFGY